jgi:hypothetical protein
MTARDRALELLRRIIAEADDADADCTARECMVALEGLGYRPTEARPPAEWKMHGTGTGPSEAVRAELEAAKARAAEAAARFRDEDEAVR